MLFNLKCEEVIMKLEIVNGDIVNADKVYDSTDNEEALVCSFMDDWEDTLHQDALEDLIESVLFYILNLDYLPEEEQYENFHFKLLQYSKLNYDAKYEIYATNKRTNITSCISILYFKLNKMSVYMLQN